MDFAGILMVAATEGGGAAAGETLGPELVTNGDFAAGETGWTVLNLSGNTGASGGVFVFNDAADDGDTLAQAVATEAATYRVVFDITAYTGGSIRATITGGGGTGTSRSAVGTFTEDLVATGAGDIFFNGVGPRLSIDNVSVKKVI